MFSRKFFIAALERAVKSAAQALLLLWGATQLDVFSIDLKQAIGLAVGAFILSILTSVVSLPIGGNGPSVTTSEQLT